MSRQTTDPIRFPHPAVIPRLPWTVSVIHVAGTRNSGASLFTLIPRGFRKSSRVVSPAVHPREAA
jgi:hypothetical protein